jgi:hypothetical protein
LRKVSYRSVALSSYLPLPFFLAAAGAAAVAAVAAMAAAAAAVAAAGASLAAAAAAAAGLAAGSESLPAYAEAEGRVRGGGGEASRHVLATARLINDAKSVYAMLQGSTRMRSACVLLRACLYTAFRHVKSHANFHFHSHHPTATHLQRGHWLLLLAWLLLLLAPWQQLLVQQQQQRAQARPVSRLWARQAWPQACCYWAVLQWHSKRKCGWQ